MRLQLGTPCGTSYHYQRWASTHYPSIVWNNLSGHRLSTTYPMNSLQLILCDRSPCEWRTTQGIKVGRKFNYFLNGWRL